MITLPFRKKYFRFFILAICFVFIGLATASFLAMKQNQADAFAATTDGQAVQVLRVGHPDATPGFHEFSIQNQVTSYTTHAFCAQTSKELPREDITYPADLITDSADKYNKIKLLIFINEYADSDPYALAGRTEIFGSGTHDMEYYYPRTHYIISEIYAGDHTLGDLDFINQSIAKLGTMISSNADVWQAAKSYQLYRITPGSTMQDLVWIEDATTYGSIKVNKCDAKTNQCTATAPATLAGIEFEVYNTSGSRIYNTVTHQFYNNNDLVATGQTNSSGVVTFNNLLANNIKYTVKETVTNQWYQLSAPDQNTTLTTSGATNSLSFYNYPKNGKITVSKIDSDTGTCTTSSDSTFNGITFTLTQNNTTIATKTLSSGNCSVVFDELAYGTYTISESNVPAEYNSDSNKTVTISDANVNAKVTFSNSAKKGKITVNKTDSVTGANTPQGSATFNGTKFRIKNKSSKAIYYGGNSIAVNGEVVTKTLTNNASTAVFDNLPYGTYEVEEIAVGKGYNRNTTVKTITIPTNNNTNITTSFANTPIIGKLTVKIIDEDTGSCVNTRGLTFNGAKFTVTNKSANPIQYGGRTIAVGGTIEVKTYADDNCSITIDDLPIGEYEVKQTGVTEGYSIDTGTHPASITPENLHPVVTLIDKPFRGDVKFIKMDGTNNKPLKDVVFTITAVDGDFNPIETHVVVTNQDGVLDTSSEFALHSNHTNGYDAIYESAESVLFLGYGVWFGTDELGNPIRIADNERALPYGKYIIEEMHCGSNLFCTDVLKQKTTITINSANQVINLGDWDNTCTNFSLDTTATDAADGDHYVEIGETVEIVDVVDYCVKPNTNFTLVGTLMDKVTGEPLSINGETFEKSIKLRSDTECGQTKMTFTLPGSDELGGKEIVTFETLYYNDEVITRHNDINDDSQTVTLIKLFTHATNNATGEKILPLNNDTVIKDHVTYCLKPGAEYTLKSVLMNKNTGNGILINNKPVELETIFTPTKVCDEMDIYFQINTTDLGGVDLVIFESLYLDDELILEHRDINNQSETVSIAPPVPNTGFMTRLVGDGGSTMQIVYIVGGIVAFGVGGYIISRHHTKKKFYKKF